MLIKIVHQDAEQQLLSFLQQKGLLAAIKESGKQPGKDILTAGVDWDNLGLAAVSKGEMEADAGGHFMEGAWAIIAVHDYLAGLDFAKNGDASLHSKMGVLTRQNVEQYTKKFGTNDFTQIDFKKLSRHENPILKEYPLDITTLLVTESSGSSTDSKPKPGTFAQ